MIFAELDYPVSYVEFHETLARHLMSNFNHVESGLQSDSWFWISDGEFRVEIHTFYSTKHQVTSAFAGDHIKTVIDVLQRGFKVKVYPQPTREPHEGDASELH
ncbi:hypothetical protein IP84_03715 [beta proteobacterium AAP99]|nr:hypothetical protein IP84_03715 [beta proteobacterium AAP99]